MCLAQITSSEIAAHGYAGLHYLLPRANPNSLWSRSCMGGVADKSCKLPFLIMLEEEGAIEYHSIRNQRMSKVHTRWVTYLAGTRREPYVPGPSARSPGRARTARPRRWNGGPGRKERKRQARGRLQQGAAPSPGGGPGRAVPRPSGPPSPPLPGAAGTARSPPLPPSPEGCPWPGGPSAARQCPPCRPRWGPAFGRGWRSGSRHPCSRRRRPPAGGRLAAAGTCRAGTDAQCPRLRRLGADQTPPGMLPAPAAARGGEGRREKGPPRPAEGGRAGSGGARSARAPPRAGRDTGGERERLQPLGLLTAHVRAYALVAALRFQHKHRNTTSGAKDQVSILRLVLVPPIPV